MTGRPVAEEITRRVISPLGLRHTYVPAVGEKALREPHPRGYHAGTPGAQLRDITSLAPSWAGAAGRFVSTPGDPNRFFSTLLGGELLEPARLRAMRSTVAAPGTWPGARYGLGLFSTPLTCGGLVWGHGGDIPGYETRGRSHRPGQGRDGGRHGAACGSARTTAGGGRSSEVRGRRVVLLGRACGLTTGQPSA